MALHILHIRCQDCWKITQIRRPNQSILIPKIVAAFKCPHCHPEIRSSICGGCLVPWTIVKLHSNGLCNVCVVRDLRYKRALQVKLPA